MFRVCDWTHLSFNTFYYLVYTSPATSPYSSPSDTQQLPRFTLPYPLHNIHTTHFNNTRTRTHLAQHQIDDVLQDLLHSHREPLQSPPRRARIQKIYPTNNKNRITYYSRKCLPSHPPGLLSKTTRSLSPAASPPFFGRSAPRKPSTTNSPSSSAAISTIKVQRHSSSLLESSSTAQRRRTSRRHTTAS